MVSNIFVASTPQTWGRWSQIWLVISCDFFQVGEPTTNYRYIDHWTKGNQNEVCRGFFLGPGRRILCCGWLVSESYLDLTFVGWKLDLLGLVEGRICQNSIASNRIPQTIHSAEVKKYWRGKMRFDEASNYRWWFQIRFIFTPIWGRFPIRLIFFKWVETTN